MDITNHAKLQLGFEVPKIHYVLLPRQYKPFISRYASKVELEGRKVSATLTKECRDEAKLLLLSDIEKEEESEQ
jgi:hypothetical protein